MLMAGDGLARVILDGARRNVYENGTLRSGDSIGLFGMPRLNAKALCDVVAVRTIAGCWNPGSWLGALPNFESIYWIITRLVIKIAVLNGCLLS